MTRSPSQILLLFTLLIAFCCSPKKTADDEAESKNKRLVRYFFEEIVRKGKFDQYKEIHREDFVCHSFDNDFNLEEDFQNALEVHKSMKGFAFRIIRLIEENNYVSVQWEADNAEDPTSPQNYYESGSGITILRIENEKIAEEWPSYPYFKKVSRSPADQ